MPCFAAIDVGSSAIRLSVVKLSPVGVVVDTDYHRYGVRLGADVFAAGGIRPVQARTLLDVFKEIANLMREHRVERYRAVATSAVRDARNGRLIVERIRRHTGIDIEIINGHEEARLSRDALCRALGSVPDDTLLVDLGGGSLQLYRAGGGVCRSLPMGTVRLIRNYPKLLRSLTRRELHDVGAAIEHDLRKRIAPKKTPLAIGTGGNLNALARLVPSGGGFYPAIDVSALEDGAARLAAVSPAERIDNFDLRPDRADVIIPSALTILAVVRLFNVERFIVPGTGLRDGIIQTLAASAVTPPPVAVIRGRFGRNVRSIEPLVELADHLFSLFTPVHHLWPQARAILKIAAACHDLGTAIDPIAPSSHSAYILQNLAGLGLERRAQEVAGYIVSRSANDGRPPPGISPADERPAEMLAGLLHLAAALTDVRAGLPQVTFTDHRILLHARLHRPLPKSATAMLEAALDVKIRLT